VRARHLAEEALHLVAGQDGGQAPGLFGAQGVNRPQLLVQHLTVEEQEGREGLILGRSGDLLVYR